MAWSPGLLWGVIETRVVQERSEETASIEEDT